MGRWAQRTRAGGGKSGLTVLVYAHKIPTDTITVAWSDVVKAATFSPSNFASAPSNITCTDIAQTAPNRLSLQMDDDISAETSINYIGTAPGVKSPDNKIFS